MAIRICAGLCVLLALALGARAEPAREPVERVRAALASVRFVAYTPRGFDPNVGTAPVDPAALRADLALLRRYFDGLVTYSCARGLDAVPRVAHELGYRAVVLGVWDPTSVSELALATAAARAQPETVLALGLGNEGLFFERYDASALARAFATARSAAPGVALTTSEPFSSYLDAQAPALPKQDFLLPIIHPLDQPWFSNAPRSTRVDFVVNVVGELEKRFAQPILVKETGVPSGPASQGFSEAGQVEFWSALAKALPPTREHAFVWFEAFDAPWKIASVAAQTGDVRESEAHWGLFRADGSAKPVLESLAR